MRTLRSHFLAFFAFATMLFLVRVVPAITCAACGCAFNVTSTDTRDAAGPMIMTPTANTMGKGHAGSALVFDEQRFYKIPGEEALQLEDEGHDIHGKNHDEYYNIYLGYGLLENLDLTMKIPIVSRTLAEVHDEEHLGDKERDTGFGDMEWIAKYRLLEKGVDIALIAGVKAPTGETSAENQFDKKFEIEQQPGSGSWDFHTGIAASRSYGKHLSFATSFDYNCRGEGGQDAKLGDVFSYDVGLSWAWKALGVFPNVTASAEFLNQWGLRDHTREFDKVLDSGGKEVLFSPGVSVDISRAVSLFCALPVPVYQKPGGRHEELKYELLTGLSCHF